MLDSHCFSIRHTDEALVRPCRLCAEPLRLEPGPVVVVTPPEGEPGEVCLPCVRRHAPVLASLYEMGS